MARIYKVALTNVPWDSNYDNVVNFGATESERIANRLRYFTSLGVDFNNAQFCNFQMRNAINTTITYQANENEDIIALLNKNYCVIYNTVTDKYLYFFINTISQDSANQLRIELSLDVMTQYFDPNIGGSVLFERSHLDRFDHQGYFNYRLNSKLYLGKNTQPTTKYLDLLIEEDYTTSSAKQWINDNVFGWELLYIDKNQFYNTTTGEAPSTIQFPTVGFVDINNKINYQDYVVLLSPIYKGDNHIIIKSTGWASQFEWVASNNNFRRLNNDTSYVFATNYFPFDIDDYNINIDTSTGDMVIETDTQTQFRLGTNSRCYVTNYVTPIVALLNMPIFTDHSFVLPEKLAMGVTSPVTETNLAFNSKNINPAVLENITLSYFKGCVQFDFDPKALLFNYDSNYRVKFRLFVVPEPSFLDIFATIVLNENNSTPFSRKNNKFMYGVKTTACYQITTTNSQLQSFLANNKNFFVQSERTREIELGQNITRTATNVINNLAGVGGSYINAQADYVYGSALSGFKGTTNTIGNAVGAVTSLANDIVNTGASYELSKMQEHYTTDNLASSPSTIQRATASPIITNNVTENKHFLAVQLPVEAQLNAINEYNYKYGYGYVNVDTILNNYRTMTCWNYIQCAIDHIDQPFSNEIKSILRTIFAKGVRLWHLFDNYNLLSNFNDYNSPNFERRYLGA